MNQPLFIWLAAWALRPALSLAQTAPPAGFGRTPSGIDYQLFRRDANGHYQPRPLNVPGDSAYSTRIGRYLLLHIVYLTGRDSVLESTRKKFGNMPVPMAIRPIVRPGTPDEAFSLLLPGDSAVFRFRADSLFHLQGNRPVPSFLQRSGNVVVMQAAAGQLLNHKAKLVVEQKLQQKIMAKQHRQFATYVTAHRPQENATIQAYLKKKKLTANAHQTPGGTWYVITRRGTGPLPKAGQLVSMRYRGTLLATGKEIDLSDSLDQHGNALSTFVLGQHHVIAGWDQGLAVLPRGSKAILLVPSWLAYGEHGSPPSIPASTILRFDVELVSVK